MLSTGDPLSSRIRSSRIHTSRFFGRFQVLSHHGISSQIAVFSKKQNSNKRIRCSFFPPILRSFHNPQNIRVGVYSFCVQFKFKQHAYIRNVNQIGINSIIYRPRYVHLVSFISNDLFGRLVGFFQICHCCGLAVAYFSLTILYGCCLAQNFSIAYIS